MIIIKENTLERIKTWTKDNSYILIDFDYTITSKSSASSWNLLSRSGIVPEEYVEKRQELYNHYGPLELDETIPVKDKTSYMNEWWTKHLNLLINYKISEETMNKAISNPTAMTLRQGAKEFFELTNKQNIPVIIISAGIGNFIKQFLINNNCYYDNVYLISNFIKFENGLSSGLTNEIIHTLNKSKVKLPPKVKELIKDRPNIILLGDNIGDINMIKEKDQSSALKIGFLEEKIKENKPFYENAFDIVCTHSTFHEIIDILPILQNK